MSDLNKYSVKIGKIIVPFHSILSADCSELEQLKVTVYLNDGTVYHALNIDAVELMMQLKPSVVEGHRLSYGKFDWFLHNIFGHPIMQLLSLVGMYKLAFWFHDVTVPKPKGVHPSTDPVDVLSWIERTEGIPDDEEPPMVDPKPLPQNEENDPILAKMSKIQSTYNGSGRGLFESEKPAVDAFNSKYHKVKL